VYCAYHGNFTWNGNDVKYAAMPHDIDFFDCSALSARPTTMPPPTPRSTPWRTRLKRPTPTKDLDAWYDNSGNENGDKCAWNFGTTYTTANGSTANMQIGTKDFLVQQNWVNANGGGCSLSW